MRFGSDLDLVLLYREDGTTSTGHSNFEFYTKLGQRLSSLLTSPTQFGRLYELDQRLRPFGSRGLLVPSLGTYAKFLEEAEVWNFQALTRIRHVYGDAALSQDLIGDIAAAWQRRAVPRAQVAGAIQTMLERLVAEHRGRSGPDAVTLKYAVGGMIGFEFLRQAEILLGMQQPGDVPPWTPPEQSEMIKALWPVYVDLVDLDECLALHLPRFDHVATMAQMETLAVVQARWRFADVAARTRELEARVREGFEEMGT
jgi:glutamine synthetase adenylyltransferase